MAWTDNKIKQLKKLWLKGKSAVDIAKELGISKNSVIGKVHRLELPLRQSPIKKKEEETPTPKKVVKKTTGMCRLMDLKNNTCRWPIGEPTDADFHFCGKPTATGKPYCAEHCKEAYTSLKELANETAKSASKSSGKAKTPAKPVEEKPAEEPAPKKAEKKVEKKPAEKKVEKKVEKKTAEKPVKKKAESKTDKAKKKTKR